jgi:hypothetical protein
MLNTPVLLMIFNRPDTTKQVFNAIRQAGPRHLFVAADGPRNDIIEDIQPCWEARALIKVDWDCELHTLYHESNFGCGRGPATAIDWFFQNVSKGIILEDDCIPEKDFFLFCEELLNRYESDVRVFNICGSNLGFNPGINDSYFPSKFMNMSGWATWRRTAQSIDYSLAYWANPRFIKYKLFRKLSYDKFDFDYNWIRLWERKIKESITGNTVSWWDYYWILNQLQGEMISIIPSKNLVKNVGFDDRATHTKSADHAAAFIETSPLHWPLVHPESFEFIMEYEEQYIKRKWLFHTRLSVLKIIFIQIKVKARYCLNKILGSFGYEISKKGRIIPVKN